jgi:hypothetical protein
MSGAASLRQHAQWARALIAACGGLEEAAGVCRLSRSHLSRCQDGSVADCLPVDVVADLELYCGQPVYSAALVALAESRRVGSVVGQLMDEACDASEAAMALQSLAREASKDGILSERERRALTAAAAKAASELSDVVAALSVPGGGDV